LVSQISHFAENASKLLRSLTSQTRGFDVNSSKTLISVNRHSHMTIVVQNNRNWTIWKCWSRHKQV